MHEYIKDKHPEKLEIFETCQKLNIESEHYWCYLKDVIGEDLYAEESQDFVGVFKTSQMGYKLAEEKYPYPSEDELLEKVTELHITGEDIKKTKWQLLAEAYLNA